MVRSTNNLVSFLRYRTWDGLCYELKLKELGNRTTLVLSNTRELNRVPKTK